MELIRDILWFSFLAAIFALVHLNPPSSVNLEITVDVILFIALFAGFIYMHHQAHQETEGKTKRTV